MDKHEIRKILCECIKANQILNGIVEIDITPEIHPIGELECFDSMTAMEVIVEVELSLEESLGKELDLDVGLFFSHSKKEGLKKERPHCSLSIDCVFRRIVTTHSAANCPPIPLDCDHPFRNIVTTDSAAL